MIRDQKSRREQRARVGKESEAGIVAGRQTERRKRVLAKQKQRQGEKTMQSQLHINKSFVSSFSPPFLLLNLLFRLFCRLFEMVPTPRPSLLFVVIKIKRHKLARGTHQGWRAQYTHSHKHAGITRTRNHHKNE